jgi:S-ribosylhomocysteine lyase
MDASSVASFTIDHDKLLRGIYVSRKDSVGNEVLTTFDIRMKRPNIEPAMDIAAVHTLEHLLAVFLRTDEEWKDKVIYVGPMGCRTGMYVIFKGDLQPKDILDVMQRAYKFMAEFEGTVPATVSKECGNYLDHNLTYAKWECKKYLEEVLMNMKEENMIYPQ